MQQDSHSLFHIQDQQSLEVMSLVPVPTWVLDLDMFVFWWGNAAALELWEEDTLEGLIGRPISENASLVYQRLEQSYQEAAREGLHVDHWKFYLKEEPVNTVVMARAVSLGPDGHRGLVCYVHEHIDFTGDPDHQLLIDAMRYTHVKISCFTLEGAFITENPASSDAYRHLYDETEFKNGNCLIRRFAHLNQGQSFWQKILDQKNVTEDFLMNTTRGQRRHKVDVRTTRHPKSGEPVVMVVEYDIHELHRALAAAEEAERIMHQIAMYDSLTGLPSLHYIQEQALGLISKAERDQSMIAVLFVDLDGFKSINDTYGHEAGDFVLKEVAKRLKSAMREYDHIARIGGDEFILLQTDFDSKEGATHVAERIMQKLSKPIQLKQAEVSVTASVGISLYPDHGDSLEVLLQMADVSMYRVKRDGKNNYRVS